MGSGAHGSKVPKFEGCECAKEQDRGIHGSRDRRVEGLKARMMAESEDRRMEGWKGQMVEGPLDGMVEGWNVRICKE